MTRRRGLVYRQTASWSEELEQQCVELLKKKLTPGEIGEILGKTRNAIIGKADRMGWVIESPFTKKGTEEGLERPKRLYRPCPPRPPRPKVKIKEREPNRPVLFGKVQVPFVSEGSDHVPVNPRRLDQLPRNGCKWPTRRGDDGEWLMCADPRVHDLSPYCKDHHQESYRASIFAQKKR